MRETKSLKEIMEWSEFEKESYKHHTASAYGPLQGLYFCRGIPASEPGRRLQLLLDDVLKCPDYYPEFSKLTEETSKAVALGLLELVVFGMHKEGSLKF